MRLTVFVTILIIYFATFFALNFFYDDIKSALGKKYYFVYTLLEYLTFAYILWTFIKNTRFRILIAVVSGAFLIFLIVFFSTVTIKRVDSIPIGVESLLLFMFIFYFFYQYFKYATIDISGDYSFWLVTGILIYLGSTFFFNILAENISPFHFKKYWYFTYIGDIIKNILSAVAVILYIKHPIEKTNQKSSSVPYLDMI
ncbi:MAG: hypothetical protein H7Y42_12595 [Chitinophagaceae bacterium]|nr:hypothetical protein [Chitinophagaceae bacterium]